MSGAVRDASHVWRRLSVSSRIRTYRRYDYVLVAAALCLSLLGAVLVWSSTRVSAGNSGDPLTFFKKHLINLLIGLVLCLIASRISHRLVRAYAPILYLLSVAGLLAVLTGLGVTNNGAQSWIQVSGFTLQPSEFVKIAIIVICATLLAEKRDAENRPANIMILISLLVAAVPVLLILAQPDLGTVLMILSTLLAIIAISGVSKWWLIGLVGSAVASVFLVFGLGLLAQHQIDRFTAFLNPNADPLGVSYNVNQAEIAIGSGGLFGNGLFQGTQTAGQFVPEQRTDFIFSVAGEELGFFGSSMILLLLLLIVWRMMAIANRAEDLFGRLVAIGVASWIGFQSFQNIGMNLELLPVTGVPLPFVSLGGSSMMALWIGIGVILNLDATKSNRQG